MVSSPRLPWAPREYERPFEWDLEVQPACADETRAVLGAGGRRAQRADPGMKMHEPRRPRRRLTAAGRVGRWCQSGFCGATR